MKFYNVLLVLLILQLLITLPPMKLYYNELLTRSPYYPEIYEVGNLTVAQATAGGIGPPIFLRHDIGWGYSDYIGQPFGSENRISFNYTALYLGNVLLDLVLAWMVFLVYRIESNILNL